MRKYPAMLVVAALAGLTWYCSHSGHEAEDKSAGKKGNGTVPVSLATAKIGNIAIYLNGLGTVTPRNMAVVRTRIDGEVVRIAFTEGQFVKEGDPLADLDARPFEAQLKQAQGQMMRDAALLNEAKLNLTRYKTLLAQDSIAKQQLDTQQSLVKQYEGAVINDQGQVDNAKIQISYAHIVSPFSGQAGLRQVDIGNIVHSGDTNGIVTITQLQPITAVFTLPEDSIPAISARMKKEEKIETEAWDRENKHKIATGFLVAIDNQIDSTTGTVKLKAEFSNEDNALFPSQFVNVQCHIDTRLDAVVIPSAALQRGAQGSFVYIAKPDNTVSVQPVTVDVAQGNEVAIAKGIKAGDSVVIDGLDNLREGAKIEVAGKEKEEGDKKADTSSKDQPAKEKHHKKHE